MINTTYWMKNLESLFEAQRAGTIKAADAAEMNNSVGKVIALARASLEEQRALEKSKSLMPILTAESTAPPIASE